MKGGTAFSPARHSVHERRPLQGPGAILVESNNVPVVRRPRDLNHPGRI
jgi:hypothetical protein